MAHGPLLYRKYGCFSPSLSLYTIKELDLIRRALEWHMDHGGCKVQEIWLLISLALPAESAREQILGSYNERIGFN
jgi:hypothetical protein